MRIKKNGAGKKRSFAVPAVIDGRARQVKLTMTDLDIERIIINCIRGIVLSIDLNGLARTGRLYGQVIRVDINSRLQTRFVFDLSCHNRLVRTETEWLSISGLVDVYGNYVGQIVQHRERQVLDYVSPQVFRWANKVSFLLHPFAQNYDVLNTIHFNDVRIIDYVIALIKRYYLDIIADRAVINFFALSPIAQSQKFIQLAASRQDGFGFALARTAWSKTPAAFNMDVLKLKIRNGSNNYLAHELANNIEWQQDFLDCTALKPSEKKEIFLLHDEYGRAVVQMFQGYAGSHPQLPIDDIDILLAGDSRPFIHAVIRKTRDTARSFRVLQTSLIFIELGAIWLTFDLHEQAASVALELSVGQSDPVERLIPLMIGLSQFYSLQESDDPDTKTYLKQLTDKITEIMGDAPGCMEAVLSSGIHFHTFTIDTVMKIKSADNFSATPDFAEFSDTQKKLIY